MRPLLYNVALHTDRVPSPPLLLATPRVIYSRMKGSRSLATWLSILKYFTGASRPRRAVARNGLTLQSEKAKRKEVLFTKAGVNGV